MFDSLFRKKHSQSKQSEDAEVKFNPARSVYGRYSGDASVVKPIPIDGFEKAEIDLKKPWPLLDITSARTKSSNEHSVNLRSFDAELVDKIEVTHKRIELMLRDYEARIDGNSLDEFLAFAGLLVERAGALFQQKKFVFNNIFDRLDHAEKFNNLKVKKQVMGFKKANSAGFRAYFTRLVSLELKIYSELKKILLIEHFDSIHARYLKQAIKSYDQLQGNEGMVVLLVNQFIEPNDDTEMASIQQDDVLRLKNRIERIANSYGKVWKQQLDFIYQWYPLVDAAELDVVQKSKRSPLSKADQ